MRKLTTILFFCLGLLALPVMAGPDHDHEHGHSHGPISSDVAGQKAQEKVVQLVDKGTVDASWSGIKPATIEKKTYSEGPEWVIIFKNDKVSDKSKQTLYLFFSMNGHYIAANYTGN